MKDNVILTGFMGTGKTSLGKLNGYRYDGRIVDKFGGDALIDTLANLKHYCERLTEDFGL